MALISLARAGVIFFSSTRHCQLPWATPGVFMREADGSSSQSAIGMMARAAVLACRSVSDKPVWVSFTCDEEGRTPSGTDVLAALIVMQGMGAAAFGLNCAAPVVTARQLERLGPQIGRAHG